MLNTELFPPIVDFKVSSDWTNIKQNRRQVTIDIDGKRFAVINSDLYDGLWCEPVFVIMRGLVTRTELTVFTEIIQKVEKLMLHLSKQDITQAEIERLL